MTLAKKDRIVEARWYKGGVTFTAERAYPLAVSEQGQNIYFISRDDALGIGIAAMCAEDDGPCSNEAESGWWKGKAWKEVLQPAFNFCPQCGERLK